MKKVPFFFQQADKAQELMNEIAKIEFKYEVALPVVDFENDFEETSCANQDAIDVARADFFSANNKEAPSSEEMSADFQEFDSNNPSHACGYFLVTMKITKGQAEHMEAQFQ